MMAGDGGYCCHENVNVEKLPRVNPRLGQRTVAEATHVPDVGLPTDGRSNDFSMRGQAGETSWNGARLSG